MRIVNFLWRNGNVYISRTRAHELFRRRQESFRAWNNSGGGCSRANGYCCALLTLDKNYSSLNLPEHHNTALNEHYRELLIETEYSASERNRLLSTLQNRLSWTITWLFQTTKLQFRSRLSARCANMIFAFLLFLIITSLFIHPWLFCIPQFFLFRAL